MKLGFTLIELLVVITIIVVLLALLTPALDKAIYQAELALCGSRLEGLATGSMLYAMGSRRRYPDRPGVRAGASWPTAYIYNGDAKTNAFYGSVGPHPANHVTHDDRPILQQFISLDNLADPLTGQLDFDAIHDDSAAYSNYNLWFGFRYNGHAGMLKVGDRLTWIEPAMDTRYRDGILASDRDAVNLNGETQTCHADYDGITNNVVVQNSNYANILKFVFSSWTSRGGNPRGPVDMNFAYQDGSVRRLIEVKFREDDDRTDLLPESNTNITPQWRQTVPRSP